MASWVHPFRVCHQAASKVSWGYNFIRSSTGEGPTSTLTSVIVQLHLGHWTEGQRPPPVPGHMGLPARQLAASKPARDRVGQQEGGQNAI